MFNGGPTLNGFTLFMERIRNLRQELAERNFEISSVSVKFSVDDRVKSFMGLISEQFSSPLVGLWPFVTH